MSDKPKSIADLKLGDTVYEADPWQGKVYRRYVLVEIVTTKWDEMSRSVASGYPIRQVKISGGMFGGGKVAEEGEWGKRYFMDSAEAHRVCAERAVDLKAVRNLQIENEIRKLQEQLEGRDADH